MIVRISTSFGEVVAKPMQLVDIHDVQPMADEENTEFLGESNSDNTTPSEVAPEQTPSAKEVSSVEDPTDTPTDKQ